MSVVKLIKDLLSLSIALSIKIKMVYVDFNFPVSSLAVSFYLWVSGGLRG